MSRSPQSHARQRRCLHCGEFLEPDEPVIVTVRERYAARSSVAALGELTDEAIALAHVPCEELRAGVQD